MNEKIICGSEAAVPIALSIGEVLGSELRPVCSKRRGSLQQIKRHYKGERMGHGDSSCQMEGDGWSRRQQSF